MKRFFLGAIFLLNGMALSATVTVPLIPQPQQVEWGQGEVMLPRHFTIRVTHPSLKPLGHYLSSILAQYGIDARVATFGQGFIRLALEDESTFKKLAAQSDTIGLSERYLLKTEGKGIKISAPRVAGLVNGVATLRQLLPTSTQTPAVVPLVTVADAPHYGWRGLMIDSSRHFFTPDELKQTLDLMALYKLNKMHWHLTDDQGWRIEIKAYPLLTEQGAWRTLNNQDRWCQKNAIMTHNDDLQLEAHSLRITQKGDTLYGGFYTQDEVKDIVAYAQARGIEVIPEIDMPGHSLSAIACYPWLGCGANNQWADFSSPLCLGNDRVLQFCRDVWTELFNLFPSPYVHIGGDEVDMVFWKNCPRCQARMKSNRLADGHALQAWFTNNMQAFFTAHGKRMIGWDEMLDGGHMPSATVMWWRGGNADAAVRATRAGNDVVCCPTTHFYYDYVENDIDVEKILCFDVPAAMTSVDRQHVLGLQGNLWSEHIPSFNRLTYMALPRMIAQAEAAWVPADKRQYADFSKRLTAHYQRLEVMGVRYRLPGLKGLYQQNIYFGKGQARVTCADPSVEIRYTTDGTVPDSKARLYTQPLTVTQPTNFCFRAFGKDGNMGDAIHATFAPATYREATAGPTNPVQGLNATWNDYTGPSCAGITTAPLKGTYHIHSVAIPKEVKGNIGLVITGFIYVPVDGAYGFVLTSDDGSLLSIDGQVAVDNDGEHSTLQRSAQVALRKGYHTINVQYFDHNGGDLSLDVYDAEGKLLDAKQLFFK